MINNQSYMPQAISKRHRLITKSCENNVHKFYKYNKNNKSFKREVAYWNMLQVKQSLSQQPTY